MPPTFSAGSASVKIVPNFAHAQQMIGRWFAGHKGIDLKVNPDLDNKGMTRIHAQVAMHRPKLHIDVDHAYLARSITHAVVSMTGLTETASKLGAIINPALFAGAVAGLGQIATQAGVAGGAVALLPAVFAGLATPIAAVVVGLHGVGDAFKAIGTGDSKKIAEAMKNLAPAAREFVRDMHEMGPAFKNLRLDVQQRLFEGLGGSVQRLARTYLPVLRDGLGGVAHEFANVAKSSINVFGRAQSIEDVGEIFHNVRDAMSELSVAGTHFSHILIEITTVGTRFLPGLANMLGSGAAAMDRWVENARNTGQLTKIIQASLDAIGNLVNLLLQAGRLIVNLFAPAVESGRNLTIVLASILGEVADFLALDATRANLSRFFTAIADAVEHLRPALLALADTFVNTLLPGLGELAQTLAPVVSDFFVGLAGVASALGPAFGILAGGVSSLVVATHPLLDVIHELIVTLLPPLARLMQGLAPIISDLTSYAGDFLLHAIKELTPFLQQAADAFLRILQALLPLLPTFSQLALALLPPLAQILVAVVPLIEALVDAFIAIVGPLVDALTPALVAVAEVLAATLAPALRWLADNLWVLIPITVAVGTAFTMNLIASMGGLAVAVNTAIVRLALWIGQMGIVRVATAAWTAVQWLLNVAMSANPIGIIVIALAALVTAIVIAWRESETFRKIVTAAWDGIKTAVKAAWENVIKPAWAALVTAAQFMWNSVLKPIWAAIQTAWGALMTGIKWYWENILRPVWNVLQTAAMVLFRILVVVVFGAIKLAWLVLASYFKRVWETTLKPAFEAIGTAAKWLWHTVLQPIWHAMQIGWDALLAALRWAWDRVLKPTWDAISSAASWLWNRVLKPIFSGISRGWDLLMRGMRIVYDRVIHPMWTIIRKAIDEVKRGFEIVVKGIRTAWNKLMDILATPINFVIGVVFNKGLFKAWNWAINSLGLPKSWKAPVWSQLSHGQHFAQGGLIPGPYLGPTADNVLAEVGGMPIRVNPREFIQPVSAVDFYGEDAMEAIRLKKVPKDVLAYWASGGMVPGLAAGGMTWPAMWSVIHSTFPFARLTSSYRPGDPGYHGRGQAIDVAGQAPYPDPTGRAQILQMNRWIAARYGTNITELIHTAAGAINLLNGAPHTYDAFTRAQHVNHNHWAMTSMTPGSPVSGADPQPWYAKLWGSVTGAFDWLKSKIGAVGEMLGRFGSSQFVQTAKAVPGSLASKMFTAIKGTISNLFKNFVFAGQDRAPGDTAAIQGDVKAIAQNWGWNTGPQWDALVRLVQGESSWNPKAENPTSTASGLFQFIDGTWNNYKGLGTNATHASDARVVEQAAAGMRYIKSVYGDPMTAYRMWSARAPHWYDRGGWIPPGMSTVYNGTGRPEPVLTASEHDSLLRWQSFAQPGGGWGNPTVHVWLGDREITKLVDARIEWHSEADGLQARSSR